MYSSYVPMKLGKQLYLLYYNGIMSDSEQTISVIDENCQSNRTTTA